MSLKKNIVIIEDEIDLLTLISEICKKQNYNTYEFRTYEDFIFKYKTILPDLIITDRNLPGLNGNELIKTIRGQDSRVPIIMISGSMLASDNIDALNLGANDFITKPFNFEVLILKIQKYLQINDIKPAKEFNFLAGQRIIKYKDQEISLTDVESRIFEMLFNNIDGFVTKEQLHDESKIGSLYVHIKNLREKVSPLNFVIENVRNAGYKLKI